MKCCDLDAARYCSRADAPASTPALLPGRLFTQVTAWFCRRSPMASPWMLKRQALIVGVGLLASACAKDVWTFPGSREAEPTVGGDVYRVFCKRTAKAEFPKEMTGIPFDAA